MSNKLTGISSISVKAQKKPSRNKKRSKIALLNSKTVKIVSRTFKTIIQENKLQKTL